MKKSDLVKLYKNQLSSADMRLALGKQITAEATQSKVEALHALEMLGASPERALRGNVLSDDLRLQLTSRLGKQ